MSPDRLSLHEVTLVCRTRAGMALTLRPMQESDWPTLLKWNNDPEVLYYCEEEDIRSRTLAEVQDLYRATSEHGLLFIVQHGDHPIGECWIQDMNIPEYQTACSGGLCRRIDITVGDKSYWSLGVGTAVTAELTRFGFEEQRVERIYCCGIADYNARARTVVTRLGYRTVSTHLHPPGRKMRSTADYALSRDEYLARRVAHPSL